MRILPKLFILIFLATICNAAEPPLDFGPPDNSDFVYHGVEAVATDDPDLEGLNWHRWTTGKFTVLSIDKKQGEFLVKHIQKIKAWLMTRWGFPNNKFSAECRILCAPSEELIYKLFRINDSRAEVRKNSDGEIELSAVWLLLDKRPSVAVPPSLTVPCLAEWGQKHDVEVRPWVYHGIAGLNQPVVNIKEELASLKPVFGSEKMLNITQAEWNNLSEEERSAYNLQAAALCLMLRKEFGQIHFHKFIKSEPKVAIKNLGFTSYEHFDKSYLRYIADLSKEIVNNKTPDSYLNVKVRGK
jgi:hypothetical protein